MDLLQKLGLGGGGISDEADVDVRSCLSPSRYGLASASKQLSEYAFFDDIVTVDGGSKAGDKAIDSVGSICEFQEA